MINKPLGSMIFMIGNIVKNGTKLSTRRGTTGLPDMPDTLTLRRAGR
jgi:hypothetical protein